MLQLIRMHKEKTPPEASINWAAKYKGSMTKQSQYDIDLQLKELRNVWK
jgi:hypothetical protein